jgi:hypothetical protein
MVALDRYISLTRLHVRQAAQYIIPSSFQDRNKKEDIHGNEGYNL